MNENQTEIEQCGLIYSINEDDKTASVVSHKSKSNIIFIPRIVKYNSSEYLVTKISESAFEESEIESVEFSSDSEIQTIENFAFFRCINLRIVKIPSNSKIQKIGRNAFAWTSIESFTIPYHLTVISQNSFSGCSSLQDIKIPMNCELQTIESCAFEESPIKSLTISSKLTNLEEDWSKSIDCLESIKVSPNNPRYCLFDEQILIGKTSIEEKNFDVLILCIKNIKKIKIPSFIKIIESNAFSNCRLLQTIEFTQNSKLQKIEDYAFESTSIEFIKMPSQLKIIKDGAFFDCKKLKAIEFPTDSELQIICSHAFACSSIEYFTIPSCLVFLRQGWCSGTKKLNKIDINPNNQFYKIYENKILIGKSLNGNFNTLVLCFRNVKNITIPSFIEIIDSFSFYDCQQLQKVIIPQNSMIKKFGENSFSSLLIERITIPDHTLIIDKYAFYECNKLCIVDITENSELEEICERAFNSTPIVCFSFPGHLRYIHRGAFANCKKLQIVEFNDFSEIEVIEKNTFFGCSKLIITVSVQIVDRFMESLGNENI